MEPPPPPPPPSLPSILSHLRSLLSAASSALSAIPSPLLPTSTDDGATSSPALRSPPLPTPHPPLPSSLTADIPLSLPFAPPRYSDCPGVVRTTNPPPASSSLPAFLAAECADVSSTSVPSPARILPSELCLLRREVFSWRSEYPPGGYSHATGRVVAALCCGFPHWEGELRRSVLARSPRYGVAVDAVTRDHVFLLLRLCLKAAAAEARCSLERAWKEGSSGFGVDQRSARFECPRLVAGAAWFSAHLGVLYGESNGRFFATMLVKEAIVSLGSCLAVGVGSGGGGGAAGNSRCAGEKGSDAVDIGACPILISQVASAIAALHERSSLEEKSRALQAPHLSKYQLLLEYSKVLELGHVERSKRPNYRAVLEYDGILSHRADNQEFGRSKTKEELLAEERDYKRRRMSYRGKKMKRNPTEILRDIIDVHMEEIKQAGGVGYIADVPGDIAQNILKNNSHGGTYQERFDPTNSYLDRGVLSSRLPSCENSPRADAFGRVPPRSHETRDPYRNLVHETHGHHCQNVSEHERGVTKGSESTMDGSYSDQHRNSRHRGNSSDQRKYGYEHKRNISDYHSESSDWTTWTTETPKSSEAEYNRTSGDNHTSQNRHKSVTVNQDQFSDRYDPQSRYSDGDPYKGMCYDALEGKREIYHEEIHPHERHVKKRDHHH